MKSRFKNLLLLSIGDTVTSKTGIFASLILFLIIIVIYFILSYQRHLSNPDDRIFPSFIQLFNGIKQVVTPNQNGEIVLLSDTLVSMRRFVIGVGIGSILAIFFGVLLGIVPIVEMLFLRITVFLSKIPLIATVPIFFVLFGLGETMKILLIILGIFFFISLDIYLKVKAIPKEQIIKGLVSGASSFEVIFHVVFRQIFPAALTSIRINLLSAWLFLIMSEAFASDSGLGYRIFVVRRYLAMDIIIPYVLWIAILSFSIDYLMAFWVKRRYPWYQR